MPISSNALAMHNVAPYTGAWIEIEEQYFELLKTTTSLPTRERGLK